MGRYADAAAPGDGICVFCSGRLVFGAFGHVLRCVPRLVGKPDSAAWLRRLRTAALAYEEGAMLEGAIRTLQQAFEPDGPPERPAQRVASA